MKTRERLSKLACYALVALIATMAVFGRQIGEML